MCYSLTKVDPVVKGKGKIIPVLLTEHLAMKAC
jgi:hypothetical protein